MPKKQFQSWQTHVYERILATIPLIDAKNLLSVNKRTANVVIPVSKLANTRFHPYLGNSTSDRYKITSKVLKKNGKCRKTGFKSDEHRFSVVSWQWYFQSTQKKPVKCYKKKGECRKISFKSFN